MREAAACGGETYGAGHYKDTLVDAWLRWLKNKRAIAVLILAGVVIIALSSFGQSVQKLIDILRPAPTPQPQVVEPALPALNLEKLQAELIESQRLIAIHERKVVSFDKWLKEKEAQLERTRAAKPQTDDEIRQIVASISSQENAIEQVQTYRTHEQNDLELQQARLRVLHGRIAARP